MTQQAKSLNTMLTVESVGEKRLAGPTEYLVEWFERFTKNRDLLFRRISQIKHEGNKIYVEQKDGKKIVYHVEPFVEDFAKICKAIKDEHKGIVVYNTTDNFQALLKSWDAVAKIANLTVFFVNPFSKLEKRWAINPRTHSMITDKEALEPGLNSMFVMVDSTTKKELEQLTN